jgi:putative membrane protein
MLQWTWHHLVWLTAFATSVALLYKFGIITVTIPWLPSSIIGTAVAFYVGFKNNQSFARMWEARMIWGGIINSSRNWGMQVDAYISNFFADRKVSPNDIKAIKKRLVYRHIAWLYAHRSQLLVPTSWEHISQGKHLAKIANKYQQQFGVGLFADEITQIELRHYLPDHELDRLINASNMATQIINEQSRDLQNLREMGLIEDFRHIEMMQTLAGFYDGQGKNERIKKFPLPRQYANMSQYFTGIFLFLLPFSMMPELLKMSNMGIWLSIPITVLIGWIYVSMELVGDYSENPFQGMANDIPMLSLCRTIEIDLREMLGETDLPKPITAKNHILM